MIDLTTQKVLRDALVFFLLTTILFFLLFGMTLLTKDKWQEGLRTQVDRVLSITNPGEYSTANFIQINSPFAVSAAVYELNNINTLNTNKMDAVILRVTGIYGPQAVVFLYNKDTKESTFCGIAGIDNQNYSKNRYGISDFYIQYWAKRLPELVEDQEMENN